jgi:GNAT superfamily N-acetyltransferase
VYLVQVSEAGYRDVRRWLELAAEVEWLFGEMLDSPSFYQALLRNIERRTAYCVREAGGPPGVPLLGGMLFSPGQADRPEYRIGWLAVAARYRRGGVGRALVEHVVGQVRPPATLTVVTFGVDVAPARRP